MWLTKASGLRFAAGIDEEAKAEVDALANVASKVEARNERLVTYFEGKNEPPNLGIDTIPEGVKPVESCGWAKKAVTAVSERSRLDSFVFGGGYSDPALDAVCRRSKLLTAYNNNVSSELIHGCMFATVNATDLGAVVRFHTAESAVATWDSTNARIRSGLVVAGTGRTPWSTMKPVVTAYNLHLPGRVVTFRATGPEKWSCESADTLMDRPMMESLAYRPTGIKPFGETRITRTVRAISDDMVRLLQNMEVASSFYATPMRVLLGVSESQAEQIISSKWSTYIGSIFTATPNEDGQIPSVAQLPQVSFQEFINKARFLAQLFAAETGVPLNSLGIVQDNPSSAEAIQASREDICIAASDLNLSNGDSLREIALMAMAVEQGIPLELLSEEQQSVMAHFIDPSKPSVVSQADAMVKVSVADPAFAGTNVFYEGVGFDAPTISRIQSEKRRAEARKALAQVMTVEVTDATESGDAGQVQ